MKKVAKVLRSVAKELESRNVSVNAGTYEKLTEQLGRFMAELDSIMGQLRSNPDDEKLVKRKDFLAKKMRSVGDRISKTQQGKAFMDYLLHKTDTLEVASTQTRAEAWLPNLVNDDNGYYKETLVTSTIGKLKDDPTAILSFCVDLLASHVKLKSVAKLANNLFMRQIRKLNR